MPEFYSVVTAYRCDGCGEDYDRAEDADACCTALCEHCGERYWDEDLSTDCDGYGVLACDGCYREYEDEDEPEYASPPEVRCAGCGLIIPPSGDLRFDPVNEQRYHAHCTSGHAAMAVAA